jgi:hypothetical protein
VQLETRSCWPASSLMRVGCRHRRRRHRVFRLLHHVARARREHPRHEQQLGSGREAASRCLLALKAAIDAAGDLGIINVFGAGNDGYRYDASPVRIPPATIRPASSPSASSGTTDRRPYLQQLRRDVRGPGAPRRRHSEHLSRRRPTSTCPAPAWPRPHVRAAVAWRCSPSDPTLTVAGIQAAAADQRRSVITRDGRVVSGGRLNAYRAAPPLSVPVQHAAPNVSITARVRRRLVQSAGAGFAGRRWRVTTTARYSRWRSMRMAD